jgi:predicted SPOUT superfamily RNA methylase MTH1
MNASHQAVVQNFCTKLQAHLDSGDELRKALSKVKPIFDSAKVEQQIAMRDPVAVLIGKYKKVKPKRLEKGDYKGYLGFDAHGSAEENQARTMLQYYFPNKKKKKAVNTATPKGSAQVDVVEKALELVESMTKAQQDKFFNRVTRKK